MPASIRLVLALWLWSPALFAQPVTLVIGGTIIDPSSDPARFQADILIEGDRIAAVGPQAGIDIPATARRIDASGKFIIPGLIDVHNHLGSGVPGPASAEREQQVLARLPLWGVTTVFDTRIDMPTFRQLKATEEEQAVYARFFSVGQPFSAAGGWAGEASHTPTTPEAARATVRDLKAAGVDGIKIYYDDMRVFGMQLPVLDLEILEILIDEADAQSLTVYVHAPNLLNAKEALRAGADVLLHGIADAPVDDEILALMRDKGAYYVPTQVLYEARADSPRAWGDRLFAFDRAGRLDASARTAFNALPDRGTPGLAEASRITRENLKRIADAGIPIAMGTDSGIGGVVAGIASQLELHFYVEAGLSELHALRAATVTAAEAIGRSGELGAIAPGKLADLVILDADPLEEIGNVGRVFRVVLGGRLVPAD
jgi:imidazolonepropionase-like amidohydrolase